MNHYFNSKPRTKFFLSLLKKVLRRVTHIAESFKSRIGSFYALLGATSWGYPKFSHFFSNKGVGDQDFSLTDRGYGEPLVELKNPNITYKIFNVQWLVN